MLRWLYNDDVDDYVDDDAYVLNRIKQKNFEMIINIFSLKLF